MSASTASIIVDRWRRRPRRPVDVCPSIEPVVIDHGVGDDFGTVMGLHTADEVRDLMDLWGKRLAELADSTAAFAPQWAASNPTAASAFQSDLAALQARYTAAKGTFDPSAWLPTASEATFTAISKAMQQGYPPDGAPKQRGDWSELYARLNAARTAAGAAPLVDKPAQPTAKDHDVEVLKDPTVKALAKAGELVAHTPDAAGAGLDDAWAWITRHKTELIVGSVVVAGLVTFVSVLPLLSSLKIAKLAAVAGV